MIPVRMREHDRHHLELLVPGRDEVLAELPDSCTGVEDDDVAGRERQADARRVAAEVHALRLRNRDRSPGAVELYLQPVLQLIEASDPGCQSTCLAG